MESDHRPPSANLLDTLLKAIPVAQAGRRAEGSVAGCAHRRSRGRRMSIAALTCSSLVPPGALAGRQVMRIAGALLASGFARWASSARSCSGRARRLHGRHHRSHYSGRRACKRPAHLPVAASVMDQIGVIHAPGSFQPRPAARKSTARLIGFTLAIGHALHSRAEPAQTAAVV